MLFSLLNMAKGLFDYIKIKFLISCQLLNERAVMEVMILTYILVDDVALVRH